jgi:hypothetical protein
MTLAETIEDLMHQLAWRGSDGQPQGRVVISRDQAEDILAALVDILVTASQRMADERADATMPRNAPEQGTGTV